MSELRRRIGEVRGTEIVAAMAMDLTSTVPTTLTIFQVLYLSLSLQVKRRCLSLFCERLLIVPLTLVFRGLRKWI